MESPVIDGANAKVFVYEVTVLERHLDSLGHMNNGAYVQLFEEARWDLITAGGWGMDTVKRTGLSPVILDMQLRFRREILNRERVRIETKCLKYVGKVAKLEQVMKNAAGEAACEAVFSFALFNLKIRRLESPTPEWLRAVGL